MALTGGSWVWSAALRYLFMVPFLLCIVLVRKSLQPLLTEMRKNRLKWLVWSTVGFGLFYAPLCFAAAYSPGWLIAGTWQVTIISGSLLAPLFFEKVFTQAGPVRRRSKVPVKSLVMSLIILLGILLMQIPHAKHLSVGHLLFGIIPVLIASFAYPLGNRKMMELCEGRLDSFQRVLGMTLASLPFWGLLSLYGIFTVGLPSKGQDVQSLLVALCSGVVATVLFFKATDMVHGNMRRLASIEATQSMEVLFALIGGLLFLSTPVPPFMAWCGIVIVMFGMTLHSYASNKKPRENRVQEQNYNLTGDT